MLARGPKVAIVAAALTVSAPAAAGPSLLFDPVTGRILYAEDIDDQWHPASVTKILTAYLTFHALKSGKLTLESKLTVSDNAHAQPPSKVGLPVGAEMTVDMAIRALIVKSANDVAVMLAEGIGGSEEAFVALMNETAKRLGMSRSRFVNPHGLPAPEQMTTARDLARLTTAVLREFPEHAGLWAMSDVQIGKRRLASHNGLLRTYAGADGLKTGFICDSGYNVVASATRDSQRLVAVVLGEVSGKDRNIRAATMLEHGFLYSGWKQVMAAPTLAGMPIAPEARGVQSIRQVVHNFACNGIRRGRAPLPRRVAGKKQATPVKAKGAAAAPATAVAPATSASVAPAARPVGSSPPRPTTAPARSPAVTGPALAPATK